MNMLGLPSLNFGFTMLALPTQLNAFTKWASGNCRCSCISKESSEATEG
jgi:hypothetical protein